MKTALLIMSIVVGGIFPVWGKHSMNLENPGKKPQTYVGIFNTKPKYNEDDFTEHGFWICDGFWWTRPSKAWFRVYQKEK